MFSTFLNTFLLICIPICLIIFYFLPDLVNFYVPGFSMIAKENVVLLGRIMLIQPVFLGVSALISTLAQMENNFLAFSFAPIMYNLGIIFGVLFFYPTWGIIGLAYGVVLGAALHLLIQSISLIRIWHKGSFIYTPKIVWAEVWQLIKFSYLRAGGLFVQQIKIVSITFFASIFGVGALSITTLSINLANIPLTLIAVSLTTAAFPTLAKFYEEKNEIEFQKVFIRVVKFIIFLALPITAYIIIMRAHLVRIFLGAGAVNWDNTKLIALSLAILITVLSIHCYNLFMARVCYARHNVRIPFLVQVISTFCMLIFILVSYKITNYIYLTDPEFMLRIFKLLRIDGLLNIASAQMLILPLALAFSIIIEFILLIILTKKFNLYGPHTLKKTILDSLLASTSLFIFIYLALHLFEPLTKISVLGQVTVPGLLLQIILTSIFGFSIWYVVLKLRKNQEIENLQKIIQEKIWKKKLVL